MEKRFSTTIILFWFYKWEDSFLEVQIQQPRWVYKNGHSCFVECIEIQKLDWHFLIIIYGMFYRILRNSISRKSGIQGISRLTDFLFSTPTHFIGKRERLNILMVCKLNVEYSIISFWNKYRFITINSSEKLLKGISNSNEITVPSPDTALLLGMNASWFLALAKNKCSIGWHPTSLSSTSLWCL